MKFYALIFLCLASFTVFSQEQFTVYFDSNKFDLKKSENDRLETWLLEHANDKVVAINGYADEDGTSGFNDTLSQKRVNFVFDLIKDKIKIRDDFKTRSFGETQTVSKNKSENRRVMIFAISAKDLPRENEILGIKPQPVGEEYKPEIRYPEKIVLENPDGSKTEFKLDVAFMRQVGKANVGEKLKIDNLNFVINTFAVVPESRKKLYELLIVLQKNPDLKIEIQGHLCCMAVDRIDLSTQRAKAVYNFLVGQKIDKSRLSYKGFGSTSPIYPLPEKDEAQRAANRRVEIVITANQI